MAGERETIARITLEVGADASKLSPEMAAALARAQAVLDGANAKAEKAAGKMARAVQGQVDKINATKATRQMETLERAVAKMGGTASMNMGQLSRLRRELDMLAASGAKVPKALAGMGGGKLGQMFTGLASGGGLTGLLGSMGPGGLAAAGAVGSLAMAGREAISILTEMAAKAEHWGNVVKETGLGAQTVQQLSTLLEDAGISTETLSTSMKRMQVEIASGGKNLQKFGIDIAALKDMSPEEQLRSLAASIMAINDPAQRTAAAVAAFGRSGTEMLPVLADIASGADKMFAAFSDGQIAQLNKADKALDELSRRWKFLKGELAIGIVGTMGGGPLGDVGASIAQKLYDSGLLGEVGRGKVSPLKLSPEDKTPLDFGEPSPEVKAAADAAKSRREAAEKEAQARAAQAAAEAKRRMDEAIRAAEKQREEGAKLSKELEKSTKETKEREASERRSLEYLSDEIGFAGKFAQGLRAADASAEEIEAALVKIGFTAEEARKIIDKWAPSFEDIIRQAQRAGKSFEQIRKDLEATKAPAKAIARALVEAGLPADKLSKTLGQLSEAGGALSGMGGTIGLIGSSVGSLGNLGQVLNDQFKSGVKNVGRLNSALGAVGQTLSAIGEQVGGFNTTGGGALSGAGMGMQAGSSFGVWGTIIGGVLGALGGGMLGSKNQGEIEMDNFRRGWDGLNKYVRDNPLFRGDEFDPLMDDIGGAQTALDKLMKTGAQGKARGGLKEGGGGKKWALNLMGYTDEDTAQGLGKQVLGGGVVAQLWGKLFNKDKSILGMGGKSEAELMADAMKTSGQYNWDAMFAQAEQWGLHLREAYDEGGQALIDSMNQFLTLADEAQKDFERKTAELVAAREKLEGGLNTMKAGAQQMLEAMESADISDAARKAAQSLVAQLRAALRAAGMSGTELDPALAKSEKFQAAQKLAEGAAQYMRGAREGGISTQQMGEAGGVLAQGAYDAAVKAAEAAGKSPAEATRAGFEATAQLLREQLNNSLQSGTALDAKTQALLDEAKKNGINILADPAIQQLAVQRDMLTQLQLGNALAGSRGSGDTSSKKGEPGVPGTPPGTPPPDRSEHEKWHQQHPGQDHPPGAYPAASGVYAPVRMPDLGRGLGPRFQTHARESVLILPEALAAKGGAFISAASGYYNRGFMGTGGPRERLDRGGSGSGARTNINIALPPNNPLQSAEETRLLTDHAVKSVMRHAQRKLSTLVASRNA